MATSAPQHSTNRALIYKDLAYQNVWVGLSGLGFIGFLGFPGLGGGECEMLLDPEFLRHSTRRGRSATTGWISAVLGKESLKNKELGVACARFDVDMPLR